MRSLSILRRQFSANAGILTVAFSLVLGIILGPLATWAAAPASYPLVTVPIYPKGNTTTVSQLSDQQINELYTEVSQLPLPYAHTGDCCHDRAYYIAHWAETEKHINVVKVFVTGDFQPVDNVVNKPIRWQFHVASAVMNRQGQFVILDPSTANHAVSIEEWLALFSKPHPEAPTQVYIKERFAYIPQQLEFIGNNWNELETVGLSLMGCQMVQDGFKKILDQAPIVISKSLQEKLGDLHPMWSQQMVGADLARQYLKTQKTQTVPTAVWDYGFSLDKYKMFLEHAWINQIVTPGEHGTKVMSLLTDSGPQSVTDLAYFKQLADVGYSESAYPEAAAKLTPAKRVLPLNLSMGWDELLDYVKNSLFQAEKMNALIVNAGGNQFPTDPSDMQEFSLPSSLIAVGSLTPDGYISSFSKYRRNTFIFVPSDQMQVSKDSKMDYVSFGFTSGAAPMVTGTIVNILSLVPDLTRDQIKTILRKSSTAMVSARNQKTWLSEGSAMLNSYKAVRVAARLQQLLKTNATDVNKFLADERLYDFSQEASVLWNHLQSNLKQDFPQCPGGLTVVARADKNQQENELRDLRTVFLLNTESGFYAKTMACVLNSLGRRSEAAFYTNRVSAPAEVSARVMKQFEDQPMTMSNLAIRNVNFLTEADFTRLVSNQAGLRNEDKMTAYALRENVDLKAAEAFYQSLSQADKIAFLETSAPNRRLTFRLHILAYQAKNDDLNMEALELLRYFPQSEAADLFTDFLSKPDSMLASKMINYLDQVTPAQKARIIKQVRASKNADLIGMLPN